MFNLITIGDSTLDTFLIIDDATLQCDLSREHCQLCFNYADKVPVTKATQAVGGDAANVAVGCQKIGIKTTILTELGNDTNGKIVKEGLKKSDVDTSLIKIIKGKETRYSVILNYKSERTILSYHVKHKYSWVNLPKTNWIYYTSLSAGFETVQDKLKNYLIKNPETKLAMNPGTFQIKSNLEKIKELLPKTDILFLNKEEAEKITKILPLSKGEPEGVDHIKNLLTSLQKFGAKIVVITDSYNGSYASDENNIWSMPIYDVVAVGKTGTGDAFSSGFLSAIMLEKDIPTAMKWGTANSSSVIQYIGAQKGLLNKTGIEKMIKKFPNVVPKKI